MNQSSINNPQISEFLKPNSEEVRSKGEVLRLNATLHLQKIDQIWKIAQQDLLYYFQTYETMPYSKLTAQLLFGLERIKMVRTEHKLYFGQIFQKKKEGKGKLFINQGLRFIETEKYIKVTFILTKNLAMEFKFMQMQTFMLVIFLRIKSMGKDPFFGLICVILLKNKDRLSSIMEIGGEDFLMEWGNI